MPRAKGTITGPSHKIISAPCARVGRESRAGHDRARGSAHPQHADRAHAEHNPAPAHRLLPGRTTFDWTGSRKPPRPRLHVISRRAGHPRRISAPRSRDALGKQQGVLLQDFFKRDPAKVHTRPLRLLPKPALRGDRSMVPDSRLDSKRRFSRHPIEVGGPENPHTPGKTAR